MSTYRPSPLFAKSREPSGAGSPLNAQKPLQEKDSAIPSDAQPDEILDRIRALLTDHSLLARRLAEEAAARFPEHAGIRQAKRILNDGKATVGSGGPEPGTADEFDWLRHPPESARGKWVALVGREMVAAADTLAELMGDLRSQKLPKPALVHRIE
jgi:hypothetical protein